MSDSDGADARVAPVRTDSDGVRADSDGIRTDSDGVRTNSEGVRADSDGVRTNSDGAPSLRAVSDRLDRLVLDHRFTIAVVFPAVGVALLVASVEGLLSDALAFDPLVLLAGVLVMRTPLVAGVLPVVDRRAAAGLVGLAGYSYAVEYTGVTTGVPYGAFSYGVELGPTVGGVPASLPLLFLPLALNAYLFCLLVLGDQAERARVRLPAAVAAVVALDLVLDPGAVALGFWTYAAGGVYYGVPVSNYLGWVLSGTVAVAVLDRTFDRDRLRARLAERSFTLDGLVSFVLFWGSVNAWFGNWVPVLLAALLGASLLLTDRYDVPRWRPPALRSVRN